jgi:hypothetical protein
MSHLTMASRPDEPRLNRWKLSIAHEDRSAKALGKLSFGANKWPVRSELSSPIGKESKDASIQKCEAAVSNVRFEGNNRLYSCRNGFNFDAKRTQHASAPF